MKMLCTILISKAEKNKNGFFRPKKKGI